VTGLRGADLNLLVALAALLEERNLTRAGERINMTQPAMSGALTRLRRHFGDELLIRVNRGYQLSPFAEQTLPLVRDALCEAGRLLEVSPGFDPSACTRQFSISISDYGLTVLTAPLRELLSKRAPQVGVEFDPLPRDHDDLESYLARRDLLIGGMGLGIPGRSQVVFRDRFVCIADRSNPRVTGRPLTRDEARSLPNAAVNLGHGAVTPARRAQLEREVGAHIAVTVPGLLPLPFAVAGTQLIAIVPERLARRCAGTLGLTIAQLAWEQPALVEAAHWLPARSADPTLRWLLGILQDVSAELATVDSAQPTESHDYEPS
jgi:DNA-binding transcriptional LysR family regulator